MRIVFEDKNEMVVKTACSIFVICTVVWVWVYLAVNSHPPSFTYFLLVMAKARVVCVSQALLVSLR